MIARYLRAFVMALKLTLRGKQIAPKYPELDVWAREAARRVDNVYRTADANGLNEAARKALTLHLDGRDISMETILASVRHHATEEYVKLLLDSTPHTFVAIYASNVNDCYRVARLRDMMEQPVVKAALVSLSEHLERVPSQPNPKNL
jgi:hypothetical protein